MKELKNILKYIGLSNLEFFTKFIIVFGVIPLIFIGIMFVSIILFSDIFPFPPSFSNELKNTLENLIILSFLFYLGFFLL